jgi:4-amino-4-deoxy-L-arabinose transferase-like glycosyltransferase
MYAPQGSDGTVNRCIRPRRRGMTIGPAIVVLLVAMFLLMRGSSREDALTMDEPFHITAGYAALRLQTARLNPAPPPLLKMLAAVPLLLRPLDFPRTHPALYEAFDEPWKGWYQQGEVVERFIYGHGRDPHQIAAWTRLMPTGLTIGLGLALVLWTQRWAGSLAALLALVCFTLAPTVLAHGRLVTTDVAAAFGVTLTGFAFSRFLAHPSPTGALLAGLALGTALLLKLSTVLLLPLCAALLLMWIGLEPGQVERYLVGTLLTALSAALLVLLPYLWMTAQYPPAQQLQDVYFTFVTYGNGPLGRGSSLTAQEDFALLLTDRTRDLRACLHPSGVPLLPRLMRCPAELAIFLADIPVVRAWGAWLRDLVLTFWLSREGWLSYFWGEVSASGWRSYFPVVYALKEPLPFHLLTALGLLLALARIGRSAWSLRALGCWLRSHPADTLMLGWLVLYWGMAINANLNLGVRHLLPVFPFTIMLVARETSRWLAGPPASSLRVPRRSRAKGLVVALLLLWQAVSVGRLYPSFLAYFNETVGGPEGGAAYVVDSNLDWGQDLRRLRAFVDVHQIERIAVDYFGGGSPVYELGERYLPWESAKGPYAGWLAVSASLLRFAQGQWDPTLAHPAEDSYAWLQGHAPVAKIGYSIWVFDLRP